MRWWGWGEDSAAVELPERAATLLREELGIDGSEGSAPVALEEVELAKPQLPTQARQAIAAVVGKRNVADDRLARVTHAGGRSYADLVRLRSGDGSGAPGRGGVAGIGR